MNQGAGKSAAAAPDTRNAVVRGMGIAISVLALLGGGWWWWSSQRQETIVPAAVDQPVAAAPVAAVAPTDPYERARAQIAADRVAQPAGDNAIETYLALLADKPDDNSARQALTELLPFASRLAERAAAIGDADEVNRLIGLIERADPGYAQLGSLRARVVEIEQRRDEQLLRTQQAELAAAERAAAAARAAAAPTAATPAPVTPTPVPAAPPATTASTRPVPPPAAVATPSTTSARPAATPPVAATTPPPAARPASQVVEAEQINTIAPQYPPQALARRQEGWVDVEMIIDVRGMPRDVNVVGAQPAGVFNREAVRAAQRWRFKPRSIDGTPVESRFKRRLNFRLPK